MGMTLLIIICILAFYGLFRAASDVGKYLKRQREAQEAIEESNKVIKQYGKDKNRRNGSR